MNGLSWTHFRLPLRDPFRTAAGEITHREGLILRLTDGDITGLGEASPHPALGPVALRETESAIKRFTRDLQARGRQRRKLHIGDEAMPHALACGLETAVFDVQARDRGIPLARLLSDRPRQVVPVNAVISAEDDAEAAAQAAAARKAGFGCVKLKAGMAGDPAAERRRVESVRDALGPSVKLRLDANGAWTAAQAIDTIRELSRFGLEFVEQPVAAGNLREMARVRAATGVRIAADEDVTSPESARQVLSAGAADLLVLKPMVIGGLRAAMEIAAMAKDAGAGVIVTTTIDSGIGTAAALHLAAALPDDTPACGLATGDLLSADIIAPPLTPENGCLRLPDGPGLGVCLDEAALSRYAVAAAEIA